MWTDIKNVAFFENWPRTSRLEVWKSTRGNEVYCNLDKHFLLSIFQLYLETSFLTEIEIFTKFEISWKVILSENDKNLTSWENIMSSNMFRILFSRTFLNFHERSFKFIKSSDSVRLDDYGNNNVKLHQKFPNYFRGNAFHEYSRISENKKG